MAPNRNIRGLQAIRTLSGRTDRASQPYRAYLKIAALEMEKARRNKERESATHRVKIINARTKEIEREKAALLLELGEGHDDSGCSDENSGRLGEACRSDREGFKFRY
ncbi:MAG: hypothetical protein ACLFVT_04540 [Syntrophobacteria bacterium]